MTRVHVRLLGPCFKTGPKSTQSSSVADRYRAPRARANARRGTPVAGLSKVSRTSEQRARHGDGTGSVDIRVAFYRGARLRRPRRARASRARTRRARPGEGPTRARARATGTARPDTLRVPPGSRPGDRGFDGAPFYRRHRRHRTRAVDRHPAGRDVLLGEKCTTTGAGHRRAAACPRAGREGPAGHRPPTRSQRRRR